jgi:hypothetical protein
MLRLVNTNRAAFQRTLEEQFTPRDGFIPHYSNDLDDWLNTPYAEYGHNEIYTLILACLRIKAQAHPDDYEDSILEVFLCGGLYNLIDRHVGTWERENPHLAGATDEMITWVNENLSEYKNKPIDNVYEFLEETDDREQDRLLTAYRASLPCPNTPNLF